MFFDRRSYDPGLAYGQSKTANDYALDPVAAARLWDVSLELLAGARNEVHATA